MVKDSLRVELNLAEEKFQHTLQSVIDDYEKKLQRAQTTAAEREKAAQEAHKAEMESLNLKAKSELEKLKNKHYDDQQSKVKDYEMRITDLNLK